jgi:hypothetical protein
MESEILKHFIDNEKLTFIKNTAGSSIDAWDTTTTGMQYLPPIEWAAGIFEDAVKSAAVLNTIKRRYDSMRRVMVPVQVMEATVWTSTVGADIGATSLQAYNAKAKPLDPVEYRTAMYIARKSIDEATWGLEQDVRYRLTNAVSCKLDTETWQSLSTGAIAAGKFIQVGESFENCTAGNAVNWKPVLTPDMVVDSIYTIKATSYGFYSANQAVVTAAMCKDLIKNSIFLSSAEWGNPSVVQTGTFSNFLGLNWQISGNIPQDSGSTDVGLIFDDRFFFIANIPTFLEIDTFRRYWTDEIGFYAKCKAAMSVGDPEAGSVLYYT